MRAIGRAAPALLYPPESLTRVRLLRHVTALAAAACAILWPSRHCATARPEHRCVKPIPHPSS
ncbi:hypothetical protein CO2235_170154 [Cupriavidus oxalaticus]|uniref:Uncharacterized protein n=1 Tax=Cupriavidus oxalaticus TaxID=96344 RepID=A0A976BBE3_9BURK|nr:hypothetical protein CO2235_170154 [Cupriavidus oxalaticus]